MACGWAALRPLGAHDAGEYVCVGAPPEWETPPEAGGHRGVVAALARILRTAFRMPPGGR